MEDNKFKKDVAEIDTNVNNLDKIFNVDTNTGEVTEINVSDIKSMRQELQEIESSLPNVDNIIMSNIERANRLLDLVEGQVIRGNISGSMLESIATMINAITSAATSITGISYNNEVLNIKREELAYKEKKLTIDSIAKGAKEVHITNNNLTMTREQLLKELREAKRIE